LPSTSPSQSSLRVLNSSPVLAPQTPIAQQDAVVSIPVNVPAQSSLSAVMADAVVETHNPTTTQLLLSVSPVHSPQLSPPVEQPQVQQTLQPLQLLQRQLQPSRQEPNSSLALAHQTLIALLAAVVSTLESAPDLSLPRREMEDVAVETPPLMIMLLRSSRVPSVVPEDGTCKSFHNLHS
jgi:hypothetical protein